MKQYNLKEFSFENGDRVRVKRWCDIDPGIKDEHYCYGISRESIERFHEKYDTLIVTNGGNRSCSLITEDGKPTSFVWLYKMLEPAETGEDQSEICEPPALFGYGGLYDAV